MAVEQARPALRAENTEPYFQRRDTPITANTAVLSVRIDDIDTLRHAYMPFLLNGGLFLPITSSAKERGSWHDYNLEAKLCLLLQLPDNTQQYLSITKIVWISPVDLGNGRCSGIGLHFDKQSSELKTLIESKLSACRKDLTRSPTL